MAKINFIIPTFNNAAVLLHTLSALLTQKFLDSWQVNIIVSDDGSQDSSVRIAEKILGSSQYDYQVLKGHHSGPAAARNRALDFVASQPNGPRNIIFFLGADIILRPDAVAVHMRFHEQQPNHLQAGLGFVQWDPRIKPSEFMEWMTHGGPQNDFDSLLGTTTADPRHYFNGSHLSLKQSFLGELRFAEQFSQYGWEDVELGLRLARRGLQLHVLPQALSWHRHYYTINDIKQRQLSVGQSLVTYQRLQADEKILPVNHFASRFKERLFTFFLGEYFLCLLARSHHLRSPAVYTLLTAVWFWRGVKKGFNNNLF